MVLESVRRRFLYTHNDFQTASRRRCWLGNAAGWCYKPFFPSQPRDHKREGMVGMSNGKDRRNAWPNHPSPHLTATFSGSIHACFIISSVKLKSICLPFWVPTAWQSRENSFFDLTTRGQQGQQSFYKFAEGTRWWFGCYFQPFTTQPQSGPRLTPVHPSPWLWGQTKRIGTSTYCTICKSKCDYLIRMQ